MAKRRRLTPAAEHVSGSGPDALPPDLETKSRFPLGIARTVTRPPVAQVAGDAAERAALADVARAMAEARSEGRIVERLTLAAIDTAHIVRDRIAFAEDDMAALEASLGARGQQTPIEVVETGEGRYGLISGWRRVEALRRIGETTVLALVRRPETVTEAWRAMVEENEIRSPLSFYERARIAAEAADAGLYPDTHAAIAGLFANAPAPKRSKIAAFVAVYRRLGPALRFPAAIPEKLGLSLARVLADPGLGPRMRDTLRKAAAETAERERRVLERAIRKASAPSRKPPEGGEVAPGITLKPGRYRLTLEGPGVTPELGRALAAWLTGR